MSENCTNCVFDRVLIIMFENQYREYVMANPFFNRLARQGMDLRNFHGVMHPSQTNYIASIAGELCNVTNDEPSPKPLAQHTIVDLIEASGAELSWKAYMESYIPQSQAWCENLVPADDFPYVIKHNPFSSFKNIQENKHRWQKIVDEQQFWRDVISKNLPNYAWFTPNMWNDGHYTVGTHAEPKDRAPALVDQAVQWLEAFFSDLKFPGPESRLPPRTLVVVTFDESDFLQTYDAGKKYTYDGPNQIYTVLLGDMIQPGWNDEGYNHYSLLRTIEKNFNLGHLGKNDACANYFQFLWQREFRWQTPINTPLQPAKAHASATLGDTLFLLSLSKDNNLYAHCWNINNGWNEANTPEVNAIISFDLATCCKINIQTTQILLLCYADATGVKSKYYSSESGWQSGPFFPANNIDAIKILELDDNNGVLIVWRNNESDLHSARLLNNTWQDQQTLGHQCKGSFTLHRIGPAVFLIVEQLCDNSLQVISYNTANYNTTNVTKSKYSGPQDNTTKLQWSPTLVPVARFGAATFTNTPKELEPLTLAYKAQSPIALAELDGVLHLVHPGIDYRQLITETFSIAGVLTPLKPISYKNSDEQTTSNGYGTLAEASWSRQVPIQGTYITPTCVLTMSKMVNELVLLFSQGDVLKMVRGFYQ